MTAEVSKLTTAKCLKTLAEVVAEVVAEVAEVRLQVIEIACGGLRRFCGSKSPSPTGGRRLGASPPHRIGWRAAA